MICLGIWWRNDTGIRPKNNHTMHRLGNFTMDVYKRLEVYLNPSEMMLLGMHLQASFIMVQYSTLRIPLKSFEYKYITYHHINTSTYRNTTHHNSPLCQETWWLWPVDFGAPSSWRPPVKMLELGWSTWRKVWRPLKAACLIKNTVLVLTVPVFGW